MNKKLKIIGGILITCISLISYNANADFLYRYIYDGIRSGEATKNLPPVISTSSLTDADYSSPYSFNLQGSGKNTPLVWSSTTLPTGLSLNSSTGEISGTPSVSGNFDITFTLTDANSTQTTKDLTLSIYEMCQTTSTAGEVCSDGSIFVGTGGDGNRKYMAASDLSTGTRYGIRGIDVPEITNLVNYSNDSWNGVSFTNILTPAYDSNNDTYRTGTAAQDCRTLGSKFYLPAWSELQLMVTSLSAGQRSTFGILSGRYMASDEVSTTNIVVVDGANGSPTSFSNSKSTNTYNVRCFKEE